MILSGNRRDSVIVVNGLARTVVWPGDADAIQWLGTEGFQTVGVRSEPVTPDDVRPFLEAWLTAQNHSMSEAWAGFELDEERYRSRKANEAAAYAHKVEVAAAENERLHQAELAARARGNAVSEAKAEAREATRRFARLDAATR